MKTALRELGISRTASQVTLRSCALVSRAAPGSFAERFLEAGVEQGLLTGDAQVTAYSELLGFVLNRWDWWMAPLLRPDVPRVTMRFLGAAEERHAPGKTWIYTRDPSTGRIARHDKYPAAAGQRPADTVYREASAISLERCTILGAAGRVIERLRPTARHHLLPATPDTAASTLSFFDESTGATAAIPVDDAAEARLVDAYLRQLSMLLDEMPAETARAMSAGPVDAQAPDGLNVGLLALALSQLSRTSPAGSPYQAAVTYLGMTQGAAFLGADAATLANMIRTTMQSTDAAVVSGLSQATALLTKGLRGLGSVLQAGVVGLDIKNLVDAIASGRASAIGVAGTQLGFDIAGLGLLGASAIAALAGFTLLSTGLRELAVPLAGIAIGVTGLVRAVAEEEERLNFNLQPLHGIDEGYDTPLRSLPAGSSSSSSDGNSNSNSGGGSGGDRQFLAVAGWAPVNRIDFVKGEVGFDDATIGETSVHLSGLYTSGGHAHDWKINDGSDAQFAKSREGMDLDLWSLLWKPGRAIRPMAALTGEQRDPSRILVLATSPAVDIDFEVYSNSRAGGDFSVLGDARLDRMERRSGGQFVGDYVTSSSMAKSADVWRYAYRKSALTVVLDQQARLLALPGRAGLDDARFTFRNHDGEPDRGIHPLDQSLVDYRLIGGGGQVVLMLPADGTVRNPVTIVPSARPGESWTVLLDGALSAGGKAFEFLDGHGPGKRAGKGEGEGESEGESESAAIGFRLNGQTIRFESMPRTPVTVVAPRQPELGVWLDLSRKRAALVVDLGYAPYDIDPAAEVRTHLDALGHPLLEGGLTAQVLPRRDEGLVLLTAQTDAVDAPIPGDDARSTPGLPQDLALAGAGRRAPLGGYVDLKSGHAVLQGDQTLWIHDPAPSLAPAAALTATGRGRTARWHRTTTASDDRGVSSVSDAPFQPPPDRGALQRAERRTLLTDLKRFTAQAMDGGRPWVPLGDTPAQSRDFVFRLRRAGVDIVIDNGDSPRGVDRGSVQDRYDANADALALFTEDLRRLIEIDGYLMPKSRRRGDATPPEPFSRTLIQGDGREIDLSSTLRRRDIDEAVVLPEVDEAPRRLRLDEEAGADIRSAYNGLDLLVFDATRPASPLIRICDALLVGDHASGHVLMPDPALTISRRIPGTATATATATGAAAMSTTAPISTALALPTERLDVPILTLRDRRLSLVRDGGDLVARSGDGWDEQRLPWFFDPDAPGGDAEASRTDRALLTRIRQDDGSWSFGELVNDNLLDMVAAQEHVGRSTGRSIDWSIATDDDRRARVPRLTMDKTGQVTAATFQLQALRLNAFIAGMPAEGRPGTSDLTLPPAPRVSSPTLLVPQHG
ncbi:TcdA/TcdB pore-forming domain-containing protein [Roseateles sp. UC29_93]|uniref:TcdA/TcdB pore-forming domain-containing protein n=1 Tax=Roseateles sp. UC29_93 TaxID=3350177 RepID=UPI00366C52A3